MSIFRFAIVLLAAVSLLIAPAVHHKAKAAEREGQSVENNYGYAGKLRVEGTKLIGEDGRVVQLRGVSTHGLSWHPEYVNYEMLQQMRDEWNCNVFRVAMYTAETNGYCVGDDANREALKRRIQIAVEAARALDMYLIIDWHILSDNNPKQYQDMAVDFFREMGALYGDDAHLLYEICNEPNGSTSWADVKAYAGAVIPVIREHSGGVVLVGSPTWSQDIDQALKDPIAGFDNIMYTLHFYATTHRESLRQRMIDCIDGGLPVFVSEFGVCDASGNGFIDEPEADKWLLAMNARDVSFVMWNLSNEDESSAMLRADCAKFSGITAGDLRQAGKWFVGRMTGAVEPENE